MCASTPRHAHRRRNRARILRYIRLVKGDSHKQVLGQLCDAASGSQVTEIAGNAGLVCGSGWFALAGLHSLGKGANRTPLDHAATPPSPGWRRPICQAGSAGSALGRWAVAGMPTGRIATNEHGKGSYFVDHDCRTPDAPGFSLHRDRNHSRPRRRRRVLVPLIAQMNPDASTIAAGAPIEVDLAPIAVGQSIKVFWRGKPISINNRTPEQIKAAQDVQLSSLPDPVPDSDRVKKGHDQWLVVIGICTHLGCIPLDHSGPYRRVLLSLPRLDLRHRRPHSQRPGAAEPCPSSLRIPDGHQGQDRLILRTKI